MPSTRHKARQIALQALFAADITGHDAVVSLERMLEEEAMPASTGREARQLVAGVTGRRDAVDQLIETAAPLWPLDQVAAVDRNVLRLAAYELVLEGAEAPPSALVINEAVELAKRFGSESSARFVNGVLGTLSRSRSAAPADPITILS